MKIYVFLTPSNEYDLGDTSAYVKKEEFIKMLRGTCEPPAEITDKDLLTYISNNTDNQAFECELIGTLSEYGTVLVRVRTDYPEEEDCVQVYSTPADLAPDLVKSDMLHTVWLQR
jgi:hypothetical protein